MIVEISPKAERLLESRLTRRLIELEVADVEVPPRPGDADKRASVFFRILESQPGTLRIELWDRGEFYGARKLSAQGGPELSARRIALGAAELVRRLEQRRAAQARHREAAEQRAAQERAALLEALRWPAVAMLTKAQGAVVPGSFWLAGTGLAGQARSRSGARVELGLSWLFGRAFAVSDSASVRWLELSIAPEYAIAPTPQFGFAYGAVAAASAVHFTRVERVDDVAGELDTWSARAAARARMEPRLGRHAWLSVGPEVGAVLRRMPVVDQRGERHRLGGLWLGVGAALAIDPLGRGAAP